ncbi:MAG: tRNA lysidine(34) synthetase TilS [Phycisphaerales bacterium]
MDSAHQPAIQSVPNSELTRSHPLAAPVLRRWRLLTGGSSTRDDDRATLVACSGGPDSTALAAILALVTPKPIIAHVVHDLRSPELTSRDRDAVAGIANQLGCTFFEQNIQIKDQQGNTEHNARTARYDALAQIANDQSIQYIATGHHADDQLETMLMNLSRGAGPRGLAGIHDARSFQGLTIIRPMLTITHEQAIEVCKLASLNPIHDHTNDDESLTRNRVRHQLLPAMRELDPEIASRASTTADSCRSVISALRQLVEEHVWLHATLEPNSVRFTRDQLRTQPEAALYEVFLLAIDHLTLDAGHDQMNNQSILDASRVIKDSSTEPRTCRLGPIVLNITASQIIITTSTNGTTS